MKRLLIFNLLIFSVLGIFAQNRRLNGFVQDSNSKQAVSNVTIHSSILKKNVGATNKNGYYEVMVPDNDVVTFKILGYKPSVQNIDTRTTIPVFLEEDLEGNKIEDVVVQGFNTRSRQTLTGSSISISGKDIQDVPVANITELLQGKVAGVNIQMNNGTPGAGGSIQIRGISSITASGSGADAFLTPTSPLFVIDGAVVDDNTNYEYGFNSAGSGISPLSLIPPEDIQSIDFLKDAASTAIYGSRGAYGVIVITTKRGQSTVPIIQYQGNFFMNSVPKLRAVIGGQEERLMRIWQILNYSGDYYNAREEVFQSQILSDSLNPYFNNSTNWQDVFMRPTYNQTHSLSASGGDAQFNYKINGSYYNEAGIVKNTGFKRYTLSMNTEYKPTNKFRMFTSMSTNLGEQMTGGGNALGQQGIASSSSASSLLPAPTSSPISASVLSALDTRNDNKQTYARASLDLNYEFLTGFRLINSFSYNLTSDRTDNFTPAIANGNVSKNYNYDAQRNSLNNRSSIMYIKEFQEKHMVTVSGMSELNMNTFRAKAQMKNGFANDQMEGPFGGTGGSTSLGGVLNNSSDVRTVGLGGTFQYNYDTRYIFDATYRLDKSSAVGPEVPWVKNPSLAARWNMEKEGFLEDQSHWLDYLSLRGSWGKNIVPTGTVFDANGRIGFTGSFNNQQTMGYDWSLMPNKQLVPKTTTQMSAAVEMGILKNRFTTIQEVYYRQIDNEIWKKNLADHNAYTLINTNDVSFVNYGYEFTFRFRPLSPDKKDWNWTIDLNGAINRDILTQLPDEMREELVEDPNNNLHTMYRLGRNTLSHVLLHYRGVFSSYDQIPVNPYTGEPLKIVSDGASFYFQPGDPFWTDINGDYIIDDRDLIAVGNSQPRVTGGLSTFLQYKAFTLNINASYIFKRDIINNALAGQMASYSNPFMTANNAGGGQKNSQLIPLDQYDFYYNYGDDSALPNPFDYTRQSVIKPFRYNQTLFMEDGSYFKLNTITLGINMPREKTRRYGVTSMRFYLTANNVYTFSTYSGPNPEAVTSMGQDRTDGYPLRRSYSIGLNMQF